MPRSRQSRGSLAALAALAVVVGCTAPRREGERPEQPTIVGDVTASPSAAAPPPPPAAARASVAAPLPSLSVAAVPGVPAACRGGRLTFDGVAELCQTAAKPRLLPEAVLAEIHGPAEVAADQKARFEVQLVNRSKADIALTLRLTCGPSVHARDSKGGFDVEHENTDGTETLTSCDASGAVVDIVLEPGGMLVTPFEWRARRERYRDGKLVERRPLEAGTYELRAFTWLSRGPADEEEKTRGASVAVVAERTIIVR